MIRQDLEKGLLESKFEISEFCMESFEIFASELLRWNQKINLTALLTDSDIAIKHVIDSLYFASHVTDNENVLDIGSGAGIPAIPLKIVKPEVNVVSVDSVGKKIMFQRHVARKLNLKNFEALHTRVENLTATHAGHFDVVSSRAFSKLKMFVSLASPLLKVGGRMIALKGPDIQNEIDEAENDLRLLGYQVSSIQEYVLPLNKGDRCIVTISAINTHE